MGSITPERLLTPVIADTYPTNHECSHWPVEYVFVPDGVDLGIHEPRGRRSNLLGHRICRRVLQMPALTTEYPHKLLARRARWKISLAR